MNFIQKLTKDTQDGMWDGAWKYTEASDTYTFNVPKHYLSGLNFSIVKNNKLIIFPNGYGMTTSSEVLEQLRDAIVISLERTVKDDIKMYLSGKVQVVAKDETSNNKDEKEKDSAKEDTLVVENPPKDEEK
jgi:hypothetical protein